MKKRPPPPPRSAPRREASSMTSTEALKIGQSILDDADDCPEEGEDFAASVSSKTFSIMDTIEKYNKVTDGQATALENMRRGLDKWVDHD